MSLEYTNIDISYIISYKLSPVSSSLFDESGAERAQSKAVLNTLKTKLHIG